MRDLSSILYSVVLFSVAFMLGDAAGTRHALESYSSFATGNISEKKWPVMRVLDGDTIEALYYPPQIPVPEKVRLLDINCPERNAAGGSAATSETRRLISASKKLVSLDFRTVDDNIPRRDSFGRLLADVILADGTSLSQTLLDSKICGPYK